MIQLDDDIEATQSQIKFEISEWEDLIRITGGCLAPDKREWYLVDYEWMQGKQKCTNPGKIKSWNVPIRLDKLSHFNTSNIINQY